MCKSYGCLVFDNPQMNNPVEFQDGLVHTFQSVQSNMQVLLMYTEVHDVYVHSTYNDGHTVLAEHINN